jgi:hypothetical protein
MLASRAILSNKKEKIFAKVIDAKLSPGEHNLSISTRIEILKSVINRSPTPTIRFMHRFIAAYRR